MHESWNELYELFHEAMELPHQQRESLVRARFAGDQRKIEELIRLLHRAEDDTEGRLIGPSMLNVRQLIPLDVDTNPTTGSDDHTLTAPQVIGPYQILTRIGTGGMADVYLAERQDGFHQQVAIKLLRPNFISIQDVVRRFQLEREVLASLQHPHIAQIFDGGSTAAGRPFFVMEYVDGQPITEFCDTHQLSVRQRLQLFQQAAQAVAHAHRFGVVHRDIKPGNILVTNEGVPKLVDFGIAKLTEARALQRDLTMTSTGLAPFTPAYASPEQIRGEPVQIATDVYSLGVVLYQLLTGRRPFETDNQSVHQVARLVCESEPTRPSSVIEGSVIEGSDDRVASQSGPDRARIRRELRGDIDQIVLKALRKTTSDRYATVDAFVADIDNYFAGRPVVARRGTTRYVLGKFLRRYAPYVAASVVALGALLAGLVITSIALRRNVELARSNEVISYTAQVSNAQSLYHDGRLLEALSLLGRYIPESSARDLRGWEWYYMWRRCLEHRSHSHLPGAGGEILGLGGDPPSLILASHQGDKPRVIRWALSDALQNRVTYFDYAHVNRLQHFTSWEVPSIGVSFRSGLCAYFSQDTRTTLVLADLKTGQTLDEFDVQSLFPDSQPMAAWPGPVAFSPDGKRMATRHWFGAVVVWQITPENQIEYEHLIQADHEGGWQVAFSPEGRYLAAISIAGTVRTFDATTFVERFQLPHPKSIYCVCWNHDETLLMTGTESDGVRIFRSSDGTLVNHICKDVAVHALALSPNGKYLAIGGSDNVIRLLNCTDWTVVHKFLGHRDSVENLVFSADGSYLVSGDRRDEVRCWQMSDGTPAAISGSHTFLSWQGHGSRVWEIGYHPTQPKFATAGHDGNVHVWDDRDGQCVDTFSIGAPVLGVAYSTDAKSLAISRSVSGSSDLAYSFLWNPETHEPTFPLKVSSAPSFHANGKWYAELDLDTEGRRMLRVFEYPSMKDFQQIIADSNFWECVIAWANVAQVIAFVVPNELIYIGRIDGNNMTIRTFPISWDISACVFLPDDRTLIMSCREGRLYWFDTTSGKVTTVIDAHSAVTSLALSSDGERLATAGREGSVMLWDVEAKAHRLTLKGALAGIDCVAFSPDGKTLVAGGRDGSVHLWRAATHGEFQESLPWVKQEFLHE